MRCRIRPSPYPDDAVAHRVGMRRLKYSATLLLWHCRFDRAIMAAVVARDAWRLTAFAANSVLMASTEAGFDMVLLVLLMIVTVFLGCLDYRLEKD